MPLLRLLLTTTLAFGSARLFAHEVSLLHTEWWLRGPQESSWQTAIAGEATLSLDRTLLLAADHLERFELQEKRLSLGYRQRLEKGHWQLTHAQGDHNDILAIRETRLEAGRALMQGLSGMIALKTQGFSPSDVHQLALALEYETPSGWLLLPSLNMGKATYFAPAKTQNIWGATLRFGRYREEDWRAWVYYGQAEEAQAQAIEKQTRALKTTSYGARGEKNLAHHWLVALELSRQFYPGLDLRFETASAQLTYRWGKR